MASFALKFLCERKNEEEKEEEEKLTSLWKKQKIRTKINDYARLPLAVGSRTHMKKRNNFNYHHKEDKNFINFEILNLDAFIPTPPKIFAIKKNLIHFREM